MYPRIHLPGLLRMLATTCNAWTASSAALMVGRLEPPAPAEAARLSTSVGISIRVVTSTSVGISVRVGISTSVGTSISAGVSIREGISTYTYKHRYSIRKQKSELSR